MTRAAPSERSRVCYVNPTVLLRRPIRELILLEQDRREVGLLLPRPRGAAGALLGEKALGAVRLHTYRTLQLPFSKFEWPIPGPGYVRACWRVLRDYDVIHVWAHFYLNNLLLLLLSVFFPKKRVILTIDTFPGYSFSAGRFLDGLFKAYTWTVGRTVYALPSVITLYGDSLLPHARTCRLDERKLRVLPTGIVTPKKASRQAARAKLLRELGARPQRIVLTAGLLNPRKRPQDILALARRFPDVCFVVAGDGPLRAQLERQARDLPNVRLLGWRTDVLDLLRASDALFFPSAAEGLPGVVMEAMAVGTPVVTTDIPCTTDLIVDGREGYLCRVGDIDAFARRLALALEPAQGRRLARAAREKIHKRFNWTALLPRYDSLYE